MGFSGSLHLCLLFIRYIGNNDSADAQFLTFCKKFLIPIMEYGIYISHKRQGDLRLLPHSLHDLKHTVRGHAVAKRTDICLLDHHTFRRGIRKGNTDLYEIRSCLIHLQNKLYSAVRIRVSCGKESYECFFIGSIKYFIQIIIHCCYLHLLIL